MKKLTLIIAVLFIGCTEFNPDNSSTIIIERGGGTKDTIIANYYKLLKIRYSNLIDGNGNVVASDVSSFSIIKTETIK